MGNTTATPLRIVSIGGGTGLSTLLRGLKRFTRVAANALDITAVVTVTSTTEAVARGACAANRTCCRRETFAIAWWR